MQQAADRADAMLDATFAAIQPGSALVHSGFWSAGDPAAPD
ncbi:hypothetical protein [Streptomyces violascens]